MNNRFLDITSIAILASLASFALTQEGQFVTVKRVIDGDTVDFDNSERVRYLGVDASETADSSYLSSITARKPKNSTVSWSRARKSS